MAKFEYETGTAPWVRANFASTCCPFCGAQKVLRSYGDERDDDRRVELYCDNKLCEAREFIVLVMRTDNPFDRADVHALREIDEGLDHERLPDGMNILDPAVNEQIEQHQAGVVQRRRRHTMLKIELGG